MPTERRKQIPSSLKVCGDQRRILLHGGRIMLLDRSRYPPVQQRAVRSQLRLIRHREDQRVAEGVLGPRGHCYRIEEFGIDKLRKRGIPVDGREQVGPEPGADHRRSVQRALGGPAEAVDTCGDGGLHGGGHTNLSQVRTASVASAVALKYSALA